MSCYKNYLKSINCFDAFCKIHFVDKGREKSGILSIYKNKQNKEGNKLVSNALSDIESRANKIAVSEYSDDLWNYFNKLNLLN